MTTLKLNTLSARIQAHKMALVHIVKPPVCTERARHYTEMYQRHLEALRRLNLANTRKTSIADINAACE